MSDSDVLALPWLKMLYGTCPGFLSVVTLPGARSAFFPTSDLGRAAAHIVRAARDANVYTGCCTLVGRPASGRGSADDTSAMPGVWADFDVAGGAHKEVAGRLPLPGRDEVLALVDDLGVAPTAIRFTGGGYQLEWLFHEPMVFATAAHRKVGVQLAAAWGATQVELGRRRGWHVDNVGDLARILRPLGTVNRKRDPVPVKLIDCDPQRRYRPEDLAARCVRPATHPAVQPRAHSPRPARSDGRETPAEAFSRLVSWAEILEPAGFHLIYEHGGAGYWRHPAATSPAGTPSATTDTHDSPVCVVFSESTAAAVGLPCGPGHRLTKFRTWAALNHRGDERQAARALRQMADA